MVEVYVIYLLYIIAYANVYYGIYGYTIVLANSEKS